MSFKVPNEYRIRKGKHGSGDAAGNNGAFQIPCKVSFKQAKLNVIASDGEGWEHISISVNGENRTPTWDECCYIKDLFWDDTDAVVQYHPPKSNYVNNHPDCLHLWRPTDMMLPLPEDYLVGVKDEASKGEGLQNLMYRMMDVVPPEERKEADIVAQNMIDYGGSFVVHLGKMITIADPHNLHRIKQAFKDYWDEYSKDKWS